MPSEGLLRASYARLEVVEQGNRVHVHPDGTRHVHHEETDMRGIYVAQVPFEWPGTWGLEVLATQGNGSMEVSRFTVHVLAAPYTPALGTPAPRSQDRKSTRLNSSHTVISYAVFCLKKKITDDAA